MQPARIETLLKMLEARPDDQRARFGLALEYERLGRWDEVAAHLAQYLRDTDDEGNAYGRYARALLRLGRRDEAREAFRQGIDAASRHRHPTLADELADELDGLD